MISKERRRSILAQGKTAIQWEGEPMLGGMYGEEEVEAATAAIRDSMLVSRGFGGNSTEIPEFETAFANYVGARHAIALNSAGPGLDMAMRYLDLQPGDEVIVPAVNFVASPLAVAGAGGQIIWGEVDPQTLQLDPKDVEKRLSPRTRAIFPVHMNGLAAPLDELIALGEAHPHPKHGPIPVIGDAARACGASYKGKPLGGHGLLTVFSFHTMKNMCTLGEGGMITTDSDDVASYCRSVRFFGMSGGTWGTSNVMTKVQAAVGRVQLAKLDSFIVARRHIAALRNELLADVPNLVLPCEPPECTHSYYLYTCLTPEDRRDALLKRMDEEFGVRCLVANRPGYETHPYLRAATPGQQLPLSDELGRRIFCVPIHPAMSEKDNEYICAALVECMES